MKMKSALLSLSLMLLSSFVGLLLVSSTVLAQVDTRAAPLGPDDKEKAQKEAERRQELERKTFGLLDEIISGAWSLKLPENRSFVLMTAADLLWTHDEKRARNLFWEALNNLTSPTNPAGNDSNTKSSANDKAQSLNQYYVTFRARREFLNKVARRDPQLALDMLRATRLTPPKEVGAKFPLPDEGDLEQEIAGEAAARDPKRALQIARESLAKGLTFQLLVLLYELNRQNPETASEFAGDLIDKIQTSNVATDVYAFRLSVELLRFARIPQGVPAGNAEAPESNRLRLNEDQKRELVEILTNAALSVSANANLLAAVSEVMPEVEQFAPDRVARIKAKQAEFNRTLSKEQRDSQNLNSLFSKSTPEEMVKAAARVSDEAREELYRNAVMTAVVQGKGDALREFIKSEVEDESRRNSLNDSLDQQEILWAANHSDVEELQKLLPLIRLREQRAEAMAEIAMLLEKKGEHDAALKLLDEAQALVKVNLKSETQANALMALMLAYALVDPPRAFAIIEPVIDRANEDISKLLLLDRVIKTGVVKKGEIILQQQPGVIPLDFAIFKYGKGVVALANADFNRTKAAADRFQRTELRIMAQLLIAQALLRSPEQVAQKNQQ